jgi:hypothetical protein
MQTAEPLPSVMEAFDLTPPTACVRAEKVMGNGKFAANQPAGFIPCASQQPRRSGQQQQQQAV